MTQISRSDLQSQVRNGKNDGDWTKSAQEAQKSCSSEETDDEDRPLTSATKDGEQKVKPYVSQQLAATPPIFAINLHS